MEDYKQCILNNNSKTFFKHWDDDIGYANSQEFIKNKLIALNRILHLKHLNVGKEPFHKEAKTAS